MTIEEILSVEKELEVTPTVDYYTHNLSLYLGFPIDIIDNPDIYSLRKRSNHFNVVLSVVDTLTAKLTSNKPEATFIPIGRGYEQSRNAELANRFFSSYIKREDFYTPLHHCVKDALIFGIGILKILDDGTIEKVLPTEIRVSKRDAYNKEPKHSIQQTKKVYGSVLNEQFDTNYYSDNSTYDLKELFIMGEKGRHLIYTDKNILHDEEYIESVSPFCFLRYQDNYGSFFGKSLIHDIKPHQEEIIRLQRAIERIHTLLSVPKIFMQKGDNPDTLTNEIGQIVRYNSTPPTFYTPPNLANTLEQKQRETIEEAYKIVGISQLDTQAIKPAGLNSGQALRTYEDIKSEKFAHLQLRFEELFLSIINKIIIFKSDQSNVVNIDITRKKGNNIDWLKLKKSLKNLKVELQEISSMPKTLSGRFAFVQDMINLQIITPEEAKSLLRLPNTDEFEDLALANRDYTMSVIDKVIGNKPYLIDDNADLSYMIKIAQAQHLRAVADDWDIKEVDRLSRLIDILLLREMANQIEDSGQLSPEQAETKKEIEKQLNGLSALDENKQNDIIDTLKEELNNLTVPPSSPEEQGQSEDADGA